MNILQTVVVKQVLTEKSKQELYQKYHNKKIQLQKECDQLNFEQKKLEKSKKFQVSSLTKHFEKEIHTRQEKIKLLEFQLEQLHMLPLGSELKDKEVQAIIDIKEGDCWEDVMVGRTIIIKDGIVAEIR